MSENQNITGPEKDPQGPTPLSQQHDQSTEPSTIQTEQMEVHHHGHVHEKKKWKEYVFQFLMLFLAVFLGFLAENVRETRVERHVEREYIESLMADLKSDFDVASRNEISIFAQAEKIDSLQDLLFIDLQNHPDRDRLSRKCYEMSASIKMFYSEFFNERTITQLLGTGGMRLIKKQGVADSIMDYHSHIKFVEVQKQLYINSINRGVESMYNIYDITSLKTILYDGNFYYPNPDSIKYELLPVGRSEINRFVAILETIKIIAFTYKGYLEGMKYRSKRLHSFLAGKYDLEE